MIGQAPAARPAPPETGTRDFVFAAARIGLGLYWLYEQHWKLPPDFGLHQPRGLMFSFQQSINYPTVGIYRTFLQQVVVPHFHLFGWLVFLGETMIGLLLSLGLFTELAALLGTLQAVNLLVSQGATPEGPAIYLAILAANLFVLFTGGNRVWSLDRLLAPSLDRLARRHAVLERALAAATGRA
ncbi:MAG TPA: TQO small subunit DoxD [Chloroflexota bacterium]